MPAKTGYTIQEVEQMEEHAELVGGALVIEDRTSVTHNQAVLEIAATLKEYLRKNGKDCLVTTENVALYCSELSEDADREFYLPDVMVVCDREKVDEKGVHTAPLFVAEVSSESTRKNDQGIKMLTYRSIGVREYWVVDTDRKFVARYLLMEDGTYFPETYLHPGKLEVTVLKDVKIDFSGIM